MGKNKKVITAVVVISLVILWVGGIFVNAQMQEKQEAIRIAESEAEAEEARLEEAELLDKYKIKANKRLEESKALQIEVNSLFDSEDKELLVAELTQEQIDKVNEDVASFESSILTNAIEGTYISEISKIVDEIEWVIKAVKADLEDVKKMFDIATSLKELTIEVALMDEGTKKIEEIQKTLDELKEKKQQFVASIQSTLDNLKSDIAYINNVKDSIRLLFTDDTYSVVADGVTRDAFLCIVSLKDGIGEEKIRLELEEKLMVVSNYLDSVDGKDTETVTVNNDSAGSSATSNSGSSSSGTMNTGESSSSGTTNTGGSSSSGATNTGGSSSSGTTNNSTQGTTTQPETQRQPVWVVDVAAWSETVPIYENQVRCICACGADVTNEDAGLHLENHMLAGEYQYGSWADKVVQVQVGTQTIHHDEVGHWE